MVDVSLPEAGTAMATGTARYTYDLRFPGMLYARFVRCPHAHARITRLDTSAARAMPGVKAIHLVQGEGSEIQWALDEIVAIAAVSEQVAGDAVRAVKVDYEVLPHFVSEADLAAAPQTKPGEEEVAGDPEATMGSAAKKIKGTYGMPVIAHNCLEPHGQICRWEGDQLTAWYSTQAVSATSAIAAELAEGLKIPAANVRVIAEYVGGDFGSKLGADRWGIVCAELARKTGAPVKLMLERDAELTVAGDRPSAYAEIEVGATADGVITSWRSKSWGSGGLAVVGSPPLPYVFQIPNRRHQHVSVPTNKASSRPWLAPNHPQACYLTLSALEDLAAEMRLSPLDLILKNQGILGNLSKTFVEELEIAAGLMGWRERWHPRGEGGKGPVKRGLGLSLHAWPELTNGGVQMAEVAVDVDTGVVKIEKMVAVQDCGLIADRKAAESQVYGALVMGISYALSEEKVTDPLTGRMLNVDFESYRLPGMGDVGELVVHLMTGPGYGERGAAGLGEPPTISPGAAIANAVANAVGVRVPFLPLTPQRVLDALEKKVPDAPV